MQSIIDDILRKRPLVLDGAMGTLLHAAGKAGGCNEELNLSHPSVVADIHRSYLEAGADIISANSFGASSVVLADYGLADRSTEINTAAVALARKEAETFSTPGHPRFVAGDIGPTSKLPTLGHIEFTVLTAAYVQQMEALLLGGVDLLLIETCQDPLQVKAALVAARDAMDRVARHVPVAVSITVEPSGTMLLGTEPFAALAMAEPYCPLAFGMNCATGPESMAEHLQTLAKVSPFPLLCQPNAGMPQNVGGKSHYALSPEAFAQALADFTKRFGLSFVGGCCGTTPAHIKALVEALSTGGRRPQKQKPAVRAKTSSLYSAIPFDQEPRPFVIAEQTNVNGSKRFREFLLAGNVEGMAEMGREASMSAHAIDVCVAFAGRDERRDMTSLVARLVLKADAALMIDSTSPDTVEAALTRIPGRAIINSINLEDGGEKARRLLALARRYGAAVVALTIDEDGMARGAAGKLAVARRLVALAEDEGLSRENLLVDPLTFTLGSGDLELKDAGLQTLQGVADVKANIPGVRVLLGVSNISYGLPPRARKVLTSVFLHEALARGLDAAIINPAKIVPLDALEPEEAALCRRLLFNDASEGDPLSAVLERYAPGGAMPKTVHGRDREEKDPAVALRAHIIEGSREGLPALLEKELRERPAAEIVTAILLPAMQEVGRRFGEGRLPLPFVLQSAEVMRAAVEQLAPHLGASAAMRKGTIVLATVRGDVHDIGKNLVDAILSNNGYRVINLGIRQPAQAIAEAATRYRADAIGLSGLLVSSTEVMREDLEIFRGAGLSIPVLCGGAALTPAFVREVLAPAYGGAVHYCSDAFAGLGSMEAVVQSPKGQRR